MKKNYSNFAKRNFKYYKSLKRDGIETSKIFKVVKFFDNCFEEIEIPDDLKTENEIR